MSYIPSSPPGPIGRTTGRTTGRLSDLIQTLQAWPWGDTFDTLRQRFREDRLGITASSLTFTTLIALVPLLTVMLAVFTAFPMFSTFQVALEKYFFQSLVPDTIAKPVLSALTQFAAKANRLGTAGLAALVLTALALMLTIDRTLNAIWRVRKPRPIAQRVLVYWAAATLGPLVLGISLTLTAWVISTSKMIFGSLHDSVALALNAIEFMLLALGLAALYHYVPNTHVRRRHAMAGGIVAAVGFEVAKKGLAWWVSQVPTYSVVYGTLASLPIFLIWLYLSWVIVLMGAVIAAYAPSLSMHVVRRRVTPGLLFELAVTLLRNLRAARDQSRHGMSLDDLARDLRVDPLQIEPLLDTLVRLDWVGRLEEEGAQRYVLLCDPRSTQAQPLVAELLLEPSPLLRGFWKRAALGEIMLDEVLGV
jgi:membrane protein